LPQHAERAAICVNNENAQTFLEVLASRKEHTEGSRLARILKLEKKIKI